METVMGDELASTLGHKEGGIKVRALYVNYVSELLDLKWKSVLIPPVCGSISCHGLIVFKWFIPTGRRAQVSDVNGLVRYCWNLPNVMPKTWRFLHVSQMRREPTDWADQTELTHCGCIVSFAQQSTPILDMHITVDERGWNCF